jgi:hypothetical protein
MFSLVNIFLPQFFDLESKMKAFFLACLFFLSSGTFAQNSSQCGFIQNSDQRAMCRAQAERNPSQCGFIQNSDLRAMCKAQAEGNSSQCGFIQNSDMRAQCRAMSGR